MKWISYYNYIRNLFVVYDLIYDARFGKSAEFSQRAHLNTSDWPLCLNRIMQGNGDPPIWGLSPLKKMTTNQSVYCK